MDIKRKYNFSLKPYGKNKEYYLIRLRVSYPGNRVDLSTGCNVLTEDAWDPEVQKVKKGYLSVKGEKADIQKKTLENIINIMDDCFKYFEVQNRIPSQQQLKEYYDLLSKVKDEVTLSRAELEKIDLQKSIKTSAKAVFDRVTDSLGISPRVRSLSKALDERARRIA